MKQSNHCPYRYIVSCYVPPLSNSNIAADTLIFAFVGGMDKMVREDITIISMLNCSYIY